MTQPRLFLVQQLGKVKNMLSGHKRGQKLTSLWFASLNERKAALGQ